MGLNHSHSILSMHRNALIYKRKIFLLTVKARPSNRQNFSLMISKGNSRDSNLATFQRLSTTIGRFFPPSITQRIARLNDSTVSAYSTISDRSPSTRTRLIPRRRSGPERPASHCRVAGRILDGRVVRRVCLHGENTWPKNSRAPRRARPLATRIRKEAWLFAPLHIRCRARTALSV